MSGARILIACRDRPGIVAGVAGFLFEHGANIIDLDQHTTDLDDGMLFMRIEFALQAARSLPHDLAPKFDTAVASRFEMDWSMRPTDARKRMAILASREDHCALDLILRCRRDELDVDLLGLISNHKTLESAAALLDIPFIHIPVTPNDKRAAEQQLLDVLRGEVDVVVLARYMQILSNDFLNEIGVPIINIHHSFLPAFVGPDPYKRAFDRGVKIIGATAHYVTAELDEGPIIEQHTTRVSHRDDVADMKQIGRDVERVVLARAVRWHLEDRVLQFQNKTVVFK